MVNKFYYRRTKALTWREFPGHRELPSAGWKIHVSCHVSEHADLLASTEPLLHDAGVTYKVAATPADTAALNSGRGGLTQIGKVMTVYCSNETSAVSLARGLAQRWTSLRGPEIHGEGQLSTPSRVYLRHGGFRAVWRLDAFGRPQRIYATGKGALRKDLLSRTRRRINGKPLTFAATPELPERFGTAPRETLVRVQRLNSSQHLTGLYLGTQDPRAWVLKIPHRAEARERLANEHAVLRAIDRASHWHDEGALQIEHLPGVCAEALPASSLKGLFPALLTETEALHRRGWVHRDIKWSNVLVSEQGLRLIDFELTCALNAQSSLDGGTRGYRPPSETNASARASYDVYSLGACLVHALLGTNPSFLPANDAALQTLLRLHGVSPALRTLVKDMMHPQSDARPSLAEVRARLTKGVLHEPEGH
jgi:hypothetical protein